MKIGFKEAILVGGSGKTVHLKKGIEAVDISSFEEFWNAGNPSVQTTHENVVAGWTDTDMLECDLDVALAKFILEKTGKPEWDIGKLLVVIDLKNRQISMAMPFNEGKRYAVGVLKFEVKKAEA